MIYLVLSNLMLLVGPLLYSYLRPQSQKIQDRIIIAISLVTIAILGPECLAAGGWLAAAVLLSGFMLPSVLERLWARFAGTVHKVPFLIGLAGLLLHGLLDGAALGSGGSVHLHSLPLAVVFHRFPDGLFIWSLLYPRFGFRLPSILLVLVMVVTWAGFEFTDMIIDLHDHRSVAAFQAFVVGSLLHLVLDRHGRSDHHVHQHPH